MREFEKPGPEFYSWNGMVVLKNYLAEYQRQIERAFKELAKKYDLPKPLLYSHNAVLQCLYYRSDPVSLAEISRFSGQAAPNVTVSVNLLVANGLIERTRSKEDSRKYMVSMTDFGRKVCDDYLQQYLPVIVEKIEAGIPWEMHKRNHEYYLLIERNLRKIREEE